MAGLADASPFLRRIIGPFRRINNTAHDEPHVLAIDLPDRSSSDQSIKLVRFHSGNGFVFLDLPLTGIVDQPSAYPGSIRRIAAIAASHCSLELIQPTQRWGWGCGP
jgi:hypothetical protein